MANRNWASGGKIYSMHVKPILIDFSFVVDNTNGAGITGLKGAGVSSVFMNATSPSGVNPNPPAGYIQVKLADNYARLYNMMASIQSPNSGSDLTSVTSGTVYVITGLGTTTTAQWVARGLPIGVTPAIGVAFVATSTGALGGTGTVKIPAANGSGLASMIDIVGNPDVSLANSAQPSNGGGYLLLRCMGATSSSVTTRIATAPAAGSLISVSLYLTDSSILIQGE
jgi:hypothetical protein